MIFLDHIAKWLFSALTALALTLFSGAILSTISMMFVAPPRYHTAARSVDSSNLRMIAQSSLIYASEHQASSQSDRPFRLRPPSRPPRRAQRCDLLGGQ